LPFLFDEESRVASERAPSEQGGAAREQGTAPKEQDGEERKH